MPAESEPPLKHASLSAMLEHAKERLGATSGRALAARAEADGYDLTHTQINYLLKGTYKHTPGRKTLEAIAHLAGVPVADAYRAAGQPVPGPRFADEIPDAADVLTSAQRAVVLGLIREFVAVEMTVQSHLTAAHPGWEELADVIGLQPNPSPHVVLYALDAATYVNERTGSTGITPSRATSLKRMAEKISEHRERNRNDPTVTVIPRQPDPDLYEQVAAYANTEPTAEELRAAHDAATEDAAAAEEHRRQDESDGA